MKRWSFGVALFLAGAGARAGKPQLDDPIGRARAEEVKYGVRTPEAQLAILRAAEAETAKYARNGPLLYARAPGSVWVNLGPTDADFEINGAKYNKVDSGRVRKILVDPRDPNVVYVATAGGGVWKTFDVLTPVTTNPTTGPHWMPITENVGSLSIGSLAMNPQNPDALLLGLGDPFDVRVPGFLHSEDGGATWSSPIPLSYTAGTTTTTATSVRDIAFDPDGLTVLVATNAGLFTNSAGGIGGTTSFSVAALGTSIQAAWSIAYVGPRNWLVTSVDATGASSSRRGHLWHGTVSGTTWTWTDVTSALPGVGADPDLSRMSLAAALISANNYRVYLLASQAPGQHSGRNDQKNVFTSGDSGASWISMNMVPGGRAPRNPQGTATSPDHDQFDLDFIHDQADYNQMIIVDPKNPDAVFIGGNLAMGRSLNGSAGAASDWDLLTDWLPFGRGFAGWGPTTYAHADWHAAAIVHVGTTAYFYGGNDGGIFRSTDTPSSAGFLTAPGNSAVWEDKLNRGIVSHLVYSVATASQRNTTSCAAAPHAVDMMLGGLQDNGTRMRIMPGGTAVATFTGFNQIDGGDGFGVGISCASGSAIGTNLLSTYVSQVHYSFDSGGTFEMAFDDTGWPGPNPAITPGLSPRITLDPFYTFVMRIASDLNRDRTFIVALTDTPAQDGHVYRSVDGAKQRPGWASTGPSARPAAPTQRSSRGR